uniref:Uncharacterized protein n=1 Tax=Cacopsylla melanoneura TaxID=428564 RepID=A0A8D8QJK9_9HEMI
MGNELDHVYRLKSAAIYAISCLVRNFPTAQNVLIQNGGLNILLNEKIFVNNCENGYKLQLKIASLLTTLLQERYDAEINFNIQRSKLEELDPSFFSSLPSPHHQSAADSDSSSTDRESAAHSYEYNITLSKFLEARSKLDQYSELNLGYSLANLQWCNIAKTLFIKNNHKTNMETVTNILLTNLNLCDKFGRDKQLRNILVKIRDSFGEYEEGAELNLIQLYEVLVEGEGERRNVKEEERGKHRYDKDEL